MAKIFAGFSGHARSLWCGDNSRHREQEAPFPRFCAGEWTVRENLREIFFRPFHHYIKKLMAVQLTFT